MLKAPWLLAAVPSLLLAYGCSAGDEGADKESGTSPSSNSSERPGTDGVAPVAAVVPGYSITGGALFQGVKLPLFGDDATTASIPVVIARPGVVRLYKHVLDATLDQQTHATFRYKAADGSVQEISATKTITKDSDDTIATTVLDLAMPAEVFHEALEYQVEVKDGAGQVIFTYPDDATSYAPLHADAHSKAIHVVLVPVQYGSADRLPDTSAAQLKRLSEEMRALYPVSEVDVTLRSKPFVWTAAVDADGTGWDDLLYGLLQQRQQDGVSDDTYYYGAFAPATSFQNFCQQGCVAGLSLLSESVQDSSARGSIGLGFTGDIAAETFAHEVGHAHGREHSPCGGAAGPDPDYPYTKASIGVPGWDVRTNEFVQLGSGQNRATDFMGYCDNTWVSDYTWKALFKRVTTLSAAVHPAASIAPVAYRALRVNAAAATPTRWLGSISVKGQAGAKTVHATTAAGTSLELPQLQLDHLPGHVVYVPASLSGQTLRIDGVAAAVTVP